MVMIFATLDLENVLLKTFSLVLALVFGSIIGSSQVAPPVDSLKADSLRILAGRTNHPPDNLNVQYDVGDLFNDIFRPNRQPNPLHKRSGVTVIPNISAN